MARAARGPIGSRLADRRIRLERRVPGVDAAGQPDGAWQTLAELSAWIEPTTGTERVVAGQIVAEIGLTAWLRWRPDVTPTTRDRVVAVSDGGAVYEILSIAEVGRRIGWQMVLKRWGNP